MNTLIIEFVTTLKFIVHMIPLIYKKLVTLSLVLSYTLCTIYTQLTDTLQIIN